MCAGEQECCSGLSASTANTTQMSLMWCEAKMYFSSGRPCNMLSLVTALHDNFKSCDSAKNKEKMVDNGDAHR